MPGPPPKHPDRRQGRHRDDVGLVVVDGGSEVEVPEADRGWLKATREAWETFWRSDTATLVRDSHQPALARLFGFYDDAARARRRAESYRRQATKEPFVEGSQGQPVANPMFGMAVDADKRVLDIESKIVQLEDRFGLSPQAELKLGVTFQKRQNLEAMNRQLWAAEGAIADDDDPRTTEASDTRALPGDAAASSS